MLSSEMSFWKCNIFVTVFMRLSWLHSSLIMKRLVISSGTKTFSFSVSNSNPKKSTGFFFLSKKKMVVLQKTSKVLRQKRKPFLIRPNNLLVTWCWFFGTKSKQFMFKLRASSFFSCSDGRLLSAACWEHVKSQQEEVMSPT